jgi:small conductance mechanosensitive channel
MVAGARKMMLRAHLDEMLIGFLGNILYTSLLVVVAIAALGQLGIEATSLLALFATAGLAVGLALKDQLSNFAAGVMLIIFKPFKAGDFIEAGGVAGVVETIRVFNTVMRTADNRELTVPNAQIFSGTITNVSARNSRRIDLVVGIGYGDDIQQAKELLLAIMQGETRILAEPAPVVMVAELGESSVDLAVRPWVAADDYWTVRSDLLQSIKNRFAEAGIAIPYPQRDVHLHGEAVTGCDCDRQEGATEANG